VKYIEIDFPEVTAKKAMAIRKSKDLSMILGDAKLANGGTSLHAPVYNLLSADLRLPPSETLATLLTSSSINPSNPSSLRPDPLLSPSLPTLLLFECVLVYMPPEASSSLIQWFVDYFATNNQKGAVLGCIVYEMFGLGDPFGRVMLNNLKSRNILLPGAEPYPYESSLPNRFLDHNFTTARALTLRDIRKSYIHPADLKRTSKLEMLDEVEELNLVLQHYAITWGVKLSEAEDGSRISTKWIEWGLEPSAESVNVEEENESMSL